MNSPWSSEYVDPRSNGLFRRYRFRSDQYAFYRIRSFVHQLPANLETLRLFRVGIRCLADRDRDASGEGRQNRALPHSTNLSPPEAERRGQTLTSGINARSQRFVILTYMIERPERTEAAPYYFTYIDQVEDADVRAVLARQLEDSAALFGGIPEEQSLHRYAPEKWSIRQVLNHITDTERAFAFRALWFARGFDSPLPGFDQNIGAAGAEADAVSWLAHVEEFRHVRQSTISLFANLPAAAWMRSGIASDSRVTVRALAYMVAGHYAHHVRILRERYL